MEIIDEQTIKLDRELSELDTLVLDFVHLLEKYTEYVLISGYVAILLGRSRTTEDVDLFIPRMSKEKFVSFYRDLLQKGFWSVLVDSEDELYALLGDNLSVRFARKGTAIPNFEVKFVKDQLDEFTLREKVTVITRGGNLIISRLDLQIAYKRLVLKSSKDLEDARHLQKTFSIPEENINKYQVLFKRYGRL